MGKLKKVLALISGLTLMVTGVVGCGQGEVAKKQEKFDTFVAGFGKACVTPNGPVHMDSHGDADTRVMRGVLTDMYALTVAMTDTEGTTILWITTDLSHGALKKVELVREAVAEKYGIPRENILLGGTHNHSAVCWDYDSDANREYKEDWLEGVLKSIDAALEDRAAATMEIGRTETVDLNFVRRYVNSVTGEYLGSAPTADQLATGNVVHEEEGDEEVQMVRFIREDAKNILITQWQCHNCYVSGNPDDENHYKVTAEWVGIMREKVEEELGVHCIYLQGAAGNVVDTSRIPGETKTKNFVDKGEQLAQYVIDAYNDPEVFTEKRTGIIQTNQKYVTPERSGKWSEPDPELNVMTIGDVAILNLPQEMFSSDGKLLKEGSPFDMTLIMGYTNDTYGYSGPDWAAEHGGYELENGPYKVGAAEMFKSHYLKTLKKLHEQQEY